jgi:hypothetical protein
VDLGEAARSGPSTAAADLGGLSSRGRRTPTAAAGASLGKKKGGRKKKGVRRYQ